MKRSFYHYLMTLRGPNTKDEVTKFANDVFDDTMFPKHSESHQEISTYLEDNAYYISSMDLFDRMWEDYEMKNQ